MMRVRSFRFLFLILACLLALSAGGFWLLHQLKQRHFLPIRAVEVQGQYQFVTPEMIMKEASPFVGQGFFSVDVASLHEALLTLPGAENAEVRLVWPDKVQVWVIEQKPVARWPGGQILTDSGDSFLPIMPEAGESLPWFVGPDTAKKQMVFYGLRFQSILETVGLGIASLNYQPGLGFDLTTQNGIHVILGRERMSQALTLFTRAYPIILSQNPKQKLLEVNLVYPNGFAAKWQKITKNQNRN